MSKKLLLLQYRDDESADQEYQCFLDKTGLKRYELDQKNAIHDELPSDAADLLDDYSAIILGGSGQYDLSKSPKPIRIATQNTKHIIEHIMMTDYPTLSVCFGFQYMCMLQGGRLRLIQI